MAELTFAEWYNDKRLADVVFVHRSSPDSITAYAHRVILAGRSPYWYRYLTNPPAAPSAFDVPVASSSITSSSSALSAVAKVPTVVTSLDDDTDARPMDATHDDDTKQSPDTITILINEHIDAFRAILNHIYTGRQPSNLADGPDWLPDFVKLAWLYELPVLMNATKRYKAALTPPSPAVDPSLTPSILTPASSTAAAPVARPSALTSTSFLSSSLADGSHTIPNTGIHVSVGGTSSLSVSIGNSMMGSPGEDHSANGSTPSSPRHLSPRGSASTVTMTAMSSSMDLTASPPARASTITDTDTKLASTPSVAAGNSVARPVVIMKVDPIILAARSNYFRIMFSGRWRETQKGSVHLPNLSEAQFRAVLSYCYRGYINLHECSSIDAIATSSLVAELETPLRFGYRLIDIARFFGMPDLVHYVQSIMQPLINPTNAGAIWLASTNAMHLAPTLAKACLDYFRTNFLQCCLESSSIDDSAALATLAAASAAMVNDAKAAATPASITAMMTAPPVYASEASRRRAFHEWLQQEKQRQSSIQSAAAVVSRLPLRASFIALQPQHLLDALAPGTISVDTHVMLSIVEQWADAYARSNRPLLDRHSLPPSALASLHHGSGLAPSPTPSEEMTFLRHHRTHRRASSSASIRSDDGDDEDLILLAAYAINTETPSASAASTPVTGSGSVAVHAFPASSSTSSSYGPALPPAMEDRRIAARRLALKAALLPPGTLFNAAHRGWLLGKRPSHLPPGIF